MTTELRRITVHGRAGDYEGYRDVPCNAFCTDEVHCDLVYARPHQAAATYGPTWKLYHPNEQLVSVTEAPEAPPPSAAYFLAIGDHALPSTAIKRERRPLLVRWRFA